MDCQICFNEHPVNQCFMCGSCSNKFCYDCYDLMKSSGRTINCPSCRKSEEYLIRLPISIPTNRPTSEYNAPIPNSQRQILENITTRCNGTYAGGTKPCTYNPTTSYNGKSFCDRCNRIARGLPRVRRTRTRV